VLNGGADPRRLLLEDGCLQWLFPALVNGSQATDVLHELTRADEQLGRLGRILGIHARAQGWNPPPYRLTYCRLDPAPQYPTTELWSEGWSDEVYVQLRLWPRNGTTIADRAGPPWLAGGWIELPCDVQDEYCPGHLVRERFSEPVETPYEAAAQVRLIADWAFETLTAAPPSALRERDPRSGHPLTPHRID
jgi:hypothetical protein